MPHAAAYFWTQILAPSLNAFALVVSLLGLAIGVGLLVSASGTLAIFRRVNRRVSMRQATRALEVPRNVEGPAGKRHPLMGIAFLIGGGYTAIVLLTQVDTARAISAIGAARNAVAAGLVIDAVRWFLVVGGTAAVALGAMLLLAPDRLRVVEERANRWVSTRQMLRGSEDMHEGLDRLVVAHPRAAGALLCAGSVVATAGFALLLFR
jgi:hypothetical protein